MSRYIQQIVDYFFHHDVKGEIATKVQQRIALGGDDADGALRRVWVECDEVAAAEPADWSGMTKEEFRHRIMYERFYELLGEQTEYFDMRRRGYQFMLDYWIAHNAHPTNSKNPSATKYKGDWFVCTPEMAKRAMLLPFPTLEINSNNAITDADQNPGY